MYGKIYECTFKRSMRGSGSAVFAVWAYVIAHTRNSVVELDPEALAFHIGDDVENMVKAIEFLCSPDPRSTHKEEDGRRLVREGEFQYRVVTHEVYRNIGSAEDLKEANRMRVAAWRQRQKGKGDPKPPREESEPSTRFKPPTREELNAEAAKLGLPAEEVDKFVNFYESKGWMVGKNKMKSWPHSLRNWKTRLNENTHTQKPLELYGPAAKGW